MKRHLTIGAPAAVSLLAKGNEPVHSLTAAAAVLEEAMNTPEKGIPQDLLGKAPCIMILRGLKMAAFSVGGESGKSDVSCHQADGTGWSGPGTVRIEGGSAGLQIGGPETGAILLAMYERGATSYWPVGSEPAAKGKRPQARWTAPNRLKPMH